MSTFSASRFGVLPLLHPSSTRFGKSIPRTKNSRWARRRLHGVNIRAKMYIPTDAFGGKSVEKKGADMLKTLWTFAAVRIILAQQEGYDNEGGSSQTPLYQNLVGFLHDEPMRDGNEWIEKLMKHPNADLRLAALRILEVRRVYASEQFDFEKLQKAAVDGIKEDNGSAMKKYLEDSMAVTEEGGEKL